MLGSRVLRTTLAARDEKREIRRRSMMAQPSLSELEQRLSSFSFDSKLKSKQSAPPLTPSERKQSQIYQKFLKSLEAGCSNNTNGCESFVIPRRLLEKLQQLKVEEENSLPLYFGDSKITQQCQNSQQNCLFKRKRNATVGNISLHKYTNDPYLAWQLLKCNRPVKLVRQMKLDTPVRSDAVRFVSMACIHHSLPDPKSIPPGDVLIVAGDFTQCGRLDEIELFSNYLKQLSHTFKVIIAGNHECTFDNRLTKITENTRKKESLIKQTFPPQKKSVAKEKLQNGIYLEDSLVELFGIQIYGTPWMPMYDNMAFNLPRGQALLEKWNEIPTGVDVLVTHTPPLGHGDVLPSGLHIGCVELLNSVVKRIRPKYHVFAHIHAGYGCTTDGYTKFINCSLVDDRLQPVNNPIIFDLPIAVDVKEYWLQHYRQSVV